MYTVIWIGICRNRYVFMCILACMHLSLDTSRYMFANSLVKRLSISDLKYVYFVQTQTLIHPKCRHKYEFIDVYVYT